MREYLLSILTSNSNLSIEDIIMNVLVAIMISFIIFLSYKLSHIGTLYSRKFNVSLILLAILTSMVMTVIGNNVALSLGMVGALSIVRFRTPIKDSRDTVYIFWAIIVGICCGVGNYIVAIVGSVAVFILTLILRSTKSDNRMILIIKGSMEIEKSIEAVVDKYFSKKAILKVKNTDPSKVEFIYELTKRTYELASKKEKSIVTTLYELGEIEYVNVVCQNDEING